MQLFKTLIFLDEHRQQSLGQYAHPVHVTDKEYVWGGSTIPFMLAETADMDTLQSVHPTLDFELVDLVEIVVAHVVKDDKRNEE